MTAPDARCESCHRWGYRASNPDGEIVCYGSIVGHVPDGELVLCDSPEDGGALLCEDCYEERRQAAKDVSRARGNQ